jgi:hypothetical protein
MRQRIAIGAALAVLALAAGCAQRDTVDPGAPAGLLRSAPLDAALVTTDFGWMLTADQLLLTSDGGATFHQSNVDVPAGEARAAYFSDAQHGWVAAVADEQSLTVARTIDGGNLWEYTKIATSEPIGALSVGFGSQAQGGLLATIQTSMAFSRAEFYATADGGKSWTGGTAPVAGQIAVEPGGRVWLAGGVLSDQLYTSGDQGRTWSQPSLDVKPAVVGLPRGGTLPATVGDGTTARVALLTTADAGASWHESASVPVQGDQGVPAPLAVNGSLVLLADQAGGRVHRGSKAALKSVGAQGLPAGVSRLTLADQSRGWALASSGRCAGNKQACSVTYSLVATDNAGDSWQELLRWQERIG